MSLKKNVLANYISQIYVSVIGIVILPLYVSYMGLEAYGLVGFFALLQAWFNLLDIGLSPVMSREAARFRGGAISAIELRQLFRLLVYIFVGLALIGGVALISQAELIASKWLNIRALSVEEVRQSVVLMGVVVMLRFVSGLYRGMVGGVERQVWLSGFNISIATLRFVVVIPFFIVVGTTPVEFFRYQIAVAIVELLVLVLYSYRVLPSVVGLSRHRLNWLSLRGTLKFSLGMAFSSLLWVMVTQTDKLLLSKIILLEEYAFFTLAVLLASGILMVSGPVSMAIMPRMTKLNAEKNEAGLFSIYRAASQLTACVAFPAALLMAVFPEQLLWIWTGDLSIAEKAAPVLLFYALGNGIMAVSGFPYYLQYAKGDIKLHLIGSVLFVAFLLPAMIYAAMNIGVEGPGYAWLVANILSLLLWIPIVHRRFNKRIHRLWLLDLIKVFIVAVLMAFLLKYLVVWPEGRLLSGLYVVAMGLLMLVPVAFSSEFIRNVVGTFLKAWRGKLNA